MSRRLKIGDYVYSRQSREPVEQSRIHTIVGIDRDSFYITREPATHALPGHTDTRAVSRRQLREYGEAYGDPPGITYTLEPASPVVADSVDGYAGPVVVHGAMQ
jgi:hypothetical protein